MLKELKKIINLENKINATANLFHIVGILLFFIASIISIINKEFFGLLFFLSAFLFFMKYVLDVIGIYKLQN